MEGMVEKRLIDVEKGGQAVVAKLKNDINMKNRLMSIGLVEGTLICPLYESASGGPRAYGFRGSVFAIREEDAKNIIVNV